LIGAASAVALAGGAALAVDDNILPGRSTMFRMLGMDGPAGSIPNVRPGPMTTGAFDSKARLGTRCGWAVSYPPGSKPGDRLPVLIVLHGIGATHTAAFGTYLGLDRFLAQAESRGSAPFAIASVDGGRSYWHPRASGEDAGAMVTDEFIPLLASQGLDTSRLAILGWSMGGYGALHIASRLGAGKVAAVVAESPALWFSAGKAASGAFDGPTDFAANTVMGRQSELDGIAVRVDCGIGDGFYPAAEAYAKGFARRPSGGFSAGGHNPSYWRRMAAPQLAFVAEHLS
jgi:S-formylglutathione hydrolase FrmB